MYQVLVFSSLFSVILPCAVFPTCELCAGQIFNNKKCRWCLTSNSCFYSKYQCSSNVYTLSTANCPNQFAPKIAYNDSFVRKEVTFFILASTRWNNSIGATSIEGDTQQCLNRIRPGIRIAAGYRVNAFEGKQPTTAVIFIDDSTQRIWLCFRGTSIASAAITQGILYFLRATKTVIIDSYPVRLIKYYGNLYENFCSAGLCPALDQILTAHPLYQIMTCGHSLGGAMADIFSLHIAIRTGRPVFDYSLSAPRAGGEDFSLLHSRFVYSTFRVIRDGDIIPDMPFRNSELQFAPYHPMYEVFYESQMDPDKFIICPQPDGNNCNHGHWFRKPTSHLYLFDNSFQTFFVGQCLQ